MLILLPGVGAALIAVAVATLVSALLPAVPVLTAAVVLGIVVGQLPGFRLLVDGVLAPGIRFAARTLMRIGIVLLGLQLSLGDIADLGAITVVSIVALVVLTFFVTWWLGRMLRLPGREPLLVAAGFSICGVSAIGAMAAATGARSREQATPIALVTLCGTLAIAVLPALQVPLGLGDVEFGRWVGAGVHDVGQVVATAQTAGAAALAAAVVVKLTRVLLLAPMVAVASVVTRRVVTRRVGSTEPEPRTTEPEPRTTETTGRRSAAASALPETDAASRARPPIVPLFIVGFVLAVLLNSFVALPALVLATAGSTQTVLLAAALFALGTSVRVGELVRTGWRALIVGLASWALIAALAYAAVVVL